MTRLFPLKNRGQRYKVIAKKITPYSSEVRGDVIYYIATMEEDPEGAWVLYNDIEFEIERRLKEADKFLIG